MSQINLCKTLILKELEILKVKDLLYGIKYKLKKLLKILKLSYKEKNVNLELEINHII